LSELKKHRKLFRGTYGRVAKTNTKYWEILDEIVTLDSNFSGKPRFELSSEQIKDIKKQSVIEPIAIKGTQNFINGNELEETSTLRERVLLMNYKHKNIVRVLFFHEGEKELVYPMINGGISLESYIKQTVLKERIKTFDFIFYQIISAVKYLHDNGILHGDLKAKNILINKETKEITLIDYGACAYEHSEGFARTLCTYYVSSPEDLSSGKKNGKSSRASDIWAIGMNMIHYLHGEDIIDLLEIDTEDLQDLFKRLQVDNQGFDYPLPNEHKRKLQLGKPPKVKVEAKYRKLFLPLLMFDPSKRPTVDQLLGNPIFKGCGEVKVISKIDESKENEVIEQLSENNDENNDETIEIKFEETEIKTIEEKKEIKNEEKMDTREDETCEQDAYKLIRSDLITYLYNVLKAYNGLYCMVHIVRVMDKYVEMVKSGKYNSQFTIDDLFKDKNISKISVMAVTILMTSLLVQWRDLFTVDQLEDVLDIEQADDIIARISDVLNVMKYNLYQRTFDTFLIIRIDYEKIREVLKNDKFFTLSVEEQTKLYLL
jgi:serine/threonine protein kinase